MSAVFQIRYIFVPKLLLFVTNCFCNTFCEKSRLIFYVSGLKEELSTKHCVRSVQIRSFFWSVFYHIRTIQSEGGKIRTRKSSVFGHFSLSKSPQLLHTPIKNMTQSHRSKSAQAIDNQNQMFVNRFYNILNVIRRTYGIQLYECIEDLTLCLRIQSIYALFIIQLNKVEKAIAVGDCLGQFCKMGFCKTSQKSQKNNDDEVSIQCKVTD